MSEHIRYARNRREFLTDCFAGFGGLAFAGLSAEAQRYNPLVPKPPHFAAKAKAMIFLFQIGRAHV